MKHYEDFIRKGYRIYNIRVARQEHFRRQLLTLGLHSFFQDGLLFVKNS